MSQIPIAYIDIRFFAHATEDLNRVVKAVETILPNNYLDHIVFKRKKLRGHYGNPIILFETRIKQLKIIEAFIKKLSNSLTLLDNETFIREIELRVEKGSLYIRLNKQAAFEGEFKLCTTDPIRVRIRFRKKKTEDIIKVCQKIGMLP